MKVRALKTGFYLGRRREGSVFEIPDHYKLGNWLERVDVAEPVKKPAKAKAQAPAVDPVDDLSA